MFGPDSPYSRLQKACHDTNTFIIPSFLLDAAEWTKCETSERYVHMTSTV